MKYAKIDIQKAAELTPELGGEAENKYLDNPESTGNWLMSALGDDPIAYGAWIMGFAVGIEIERKRLEETDN